MSVDAHDLEPQISRSPTGRGRPTRGTIIAVLGVVVALGIVGKLAPIVRQRMLPEYAQPAFIEAHYARQLETLRVMAHSGQRVGDNDKDCFASQGVLGAMIIDGYGDRSRRGRVVKPFDQAPGAGIWFPAEPTTDRPSVSVWSDGSVIYELQVRAKDQQLRGFELILDVDALKKLRG